MIRLLFNGAAILSLVVGLVVGALWALGHHVATAAPPAPSTELVQAELARPAQGFHFATGRLGGVVYFLREQLRVRLAVDWDSLADVGLERQTPVQFWASRCVGDSMATFGKRHGVVFVTRGNKLVLTTPAGIDAGVLDLVPVVKSPDPRRLEFVHREHRWTVAAHEGSVKVWRTPADPATSFRPSTPVATRTTPATSWEAKVAGVAFNRDGYPYETVRVDVRMWTVLAVASVLPCLWTADGVLRRRRHRPGTCPACGYDLRATPERCPECGRAVGRALVVGQVGR